MVRIWYFLLIYLCICAMILLLTLALCKWLSYSFSYLLTYLLMQNKNYHKEFWIAYLWSQTGMPSRSCTILHCHLFVALVPDDVACYHMMQPVTKFLSPVFKNTYFTFSSDLKTRLYVFFSKWRIKNLEKVISDSLVLNPSKPVDKTIKWHGRLI